jgi:hypothetical protein
MAGLFPDAPVCSIAMDLLKAGKFGDRSKVGRLGFSVLVDGRKDRVDRRRVRQGSGGNCSGNGAAGGNGE